MGQERFGRQESSASSGSRPGQEGSAWQRRQETTQERPIRAETREDLESLVKEYNKLEEERGLYFEHMFGPATEEGRRRAQRLKRIAPVIVELAKKLGLNLRQDPRGIIIETQADLKKRELKKQLEKIDGELERYQSHRPDNPILNLEGLVKSFSFLGRKIRKEEYGRYKDKLREEKEKFEKLKIEKSHIENLLSQLGP
ncbi:MAG: hypothetical protein AAB792_02100 [Patescibacteria group bacterium]